MTQLQQELHDFIRTDEAASLTDQQVADHLEVKIGVVRKARKQLQAQRAMEAEQEAAIESASQEVPDEDPGLDIHDVEPVPEEEDESEEFEIEEDESEEEDDEGDVEEDPEPSPPPSDPVSFAEDPDRVPMGDDLGQGSRMVLPGMYRLTISRIDRDAGTRVRDPDEQTVIDYARQMEIDRSTVGFGALGVMFCTDLGRLVLYEGFQRVEAASRAIGDHAVFLSQVTTGTLTEAIQEAMRANRKHGRKLTRQERVDIVCRVLEDDRWGPKTSVAQIARITGDTDRAFIAEVRKGWFKRQGQEVPTTATVTRNGQNYEMDTSGMKKDHPRVHEDATEGSDVDAGTDETVDQEQKRTDDQYLQAIPVRNNLHPDLLASFDQAALARRDLQRLINSASNACIRFRGTLGDDHPILVAIEKVARIPQPVDVEGKPIWTNCRKCEGPHPEDPNLKVSTGQDPEEPKLSCRKCKGTGIRIPGL